MQKKFIDKELWNKKWFMDLPGMDKLGLLYIITNCDNVGVWSVNFPLAEALMGVKPNWKNIVKNCNDNIQVIDDGKWWLQDHCFIQWGKPLSEKEPNEGRASYVRLLKYHGLWTKYNERLKDLENRIGKVYEPVTRKHLFVDSKYYEFDLFKEEFLKERKYRRFDPEYYYEAIKNWSAQGNQKTKWIATAKAWANNDVKNGKPALVSAISKTKGLNT